MTTKTATKLVNSILDFDEEKVPKMGKKELKEHILYCEDELNAVKEILKEAKKKPLKKSIAKSLRGWRQRMYNRLRVLKVNL